MLTKRLCWRDSNLSRTSCNEISCFKWNFNWLFTLHLCIYRQAQEKQKSLNQWDPLSFPQGKRNLLCRPRVTVTATGSCSELGLQTEQTLGMRTHCPTHYKSAPEILPTEVFCLYSCAGKQGGVSVLQGTKGEAQMQVLP